MTQGTSRKGGEEKPPKPDFASCCREMAAAMADGEPAMEEMMSACGPMMRRMMAACCGGSDRTESASEDPAPADA